MHWSWANTVNGAIWGVVFGTASGFVQVWMKRRDDKRKKDRNGS